MPGNSPKILFLAAQIQPFLVAGIQALVERYNARVLVVCHPGPEGATTGLPKSDNVTCVIKIKNNIVDIEKHIQSFEADIAWGAGWMDKDYLKWLKQYRQNGCTTIMAMDAQWQGTLRQHINSLLAPVNILNRYSYAWVPGPKQRQYARKLGFKDEHILENLLTPDVGIFNNAYVSSLEKKQASYPKNFLYAGRLDGNKFLNLLTAFSSIPESELNGWKLLVAGKGELEQDWRMQSANIKYFGFLHVPELAEVMKDSGVLCLTSRKEAWGTVIQEGGASGLPLLVSMQCGAHYTMLREGHNGFLCDGDSVDDIKRGILKFVQMGATELIEMGKRSNEIAMQSNPGMWADALMSVYKS